MMDEPHLLIAGASGVIGAGALEHFARAGWRVTALSRRRPMVGEDIVFSHVSADLADREACRATVYALPPVTHLIYAAVAEAPGLVGGWYDEALIAANGRMFANILDPLVERSALRHVSLLQGTKAYGGLYHPMEVPAREDRPRDDHPNFYWLHEDHVRARAAAAGFAFTIFRPQVLLGGAPGAAMNPVAPIGAYAAITRELGRPFAYPGASTAFWELVDTGLLAEALAWAMTADAAADQIFNVTNGDVFVPAHAWPHLASALDLSIDGAPPPSLATFFAEEEVQAAWARLVARHGLREPSLPQLLGQSHHYLDLLLGQRLAGKAVPTMVSTIKLRQAGFGGCRDSFASLMHWLARMVALKLLPPMEAPA